LSKTELLTNRIFGKNPEVLLLHGAGKSNQDRLVPIAENLLKNNIGSIIFNFPGHNTGEDIKRNGGSFYKKD